MAAAEQLVAWGRVLSDGQELPPSRVLMVGGRMASIEAASTPRDAEIVVEDGWLAPGLIDLQVNGAGGVDLTSAIAPEEALRHVARTLAAHGVTGFCPTVVSSPPERIIECLAGYRPRQVAGGAECLGAHIEGPFINANYRGIHEQAVLRDATHEEIERWLSAGPPRIVTLAPELAGAPEAIARLASAGVIVSMGHSGADVAQARAGLAAGARMGTHLFNAMPPLHHRAPGLVGALLASQAMLGLVTDAVHLDPLTVELVVRLAGPDRVALVSDALAAAGAPAGPSLLGDQALVSDGRSVRRADGTLAGSAMLLDGCLRNVRHWLPWLGPAAVLQMATSTPARLLGLRQKGRVARGADADLIVLDPDWRVRQVVLHGQPLTVATEVSV
jgi:N-acetylglucosamine-6-phosphate deacetylase